MTGKVPFMGAKEQLTDWLKLHRAIDEADTQISCVSYPDAYFAPPEDALLARMAKIGCGKCPVKRECLEYALKWETDGTWGGMSAAERKAMRQRLRQVGA